MTGEEVIARGERYIMNTYNRLPLALVRGEGSYVWDSSGRKYLDFVTGLAVNSLGHRHPRVIEAVRTQLELLFHCSNLYWSSPQVELARLLVENSGLDKVFFCNSGAEANEGAIKLARKYARKKWGPGKFEIISMLKSFHGRTLATLAATGQEKFRRGFEPIPPGFIHVPFNDIHALETAVGPATCAVLLEPVQGEGGVYVGGKEYLKQVRRLCDDAGLLLVLDEVQCGMGRTGKLFAFQHYDIKPDIVTLAKALGGGLPIGAMLATAEVAAAFSPGDHASTFGGNPVACAAGVAVIKAILEEELTLNAARMGEYLIAKLGELKSKHPKILEVRGLGLLIGLELEAGGSAVVNSCYRRGLLVNCIGENVIRLLPPLNTTKEEVDQAVSILEEALSENGM